MHDFGWWDLRLSGGFRGRFLSRAQDSILCGGASYPRYLSSSEGSTQWRRLLGSFVNVKTLYVDGLNSLVL